MNREEYHKLLDKAIDKEPWFAPEWEPWVKCSEEEKEQFRIMLNFISNLYPKSLGAMEIKFEKCEPYRGFVCYEPELGHDPRFLNRLLRRDLDNDV